MATKYWISTSSGSFNTAANWSDTAAPANGDTLIFGAYGNAAVTANLSTALTGITLIIEPGYTGQIGSVSAAGVASYLVLDGGTLKMPANPNAGNLAGASLVLVNFGSSAATVLIEDSNPLGAASALPTVQILGTVLTITQTGGSLGVATRAGETATIAALKLSTSKKQPTLFLGRGVSLASCDAELCGKVMDLRDNAAQSIRLAGGEYEYLGTGNVTTLRVDAGVCWYSGTGTCTAAYVNGMLSFARDPRAKTFTDCTIYGGGSIDLRNGLPGSVTFTNPVQWPAGGTLNIPVGMKLNPAAI